MAIALDAWVRSKAIDVRLHIRIYDMSVEIVRKIEDKVIDAELLRDTARIIDIRNRAATRVALATPQTHSHADDLVALRLEFGCGNRRVDATRHGYKDLHNQ